MLLNAAIGRINDGLGFRSTGTSLDAFIQARLQIAQKTMEQGKSLPYFLLRINQTLTVLAGESQADLPVGFIRESDENRLHFFTAGEVKPFYLSRRYVTDAKQAYLVTGSEETRAPRVYAVRRHFVPSPAVGLEQEVSPGILDFIVPADNDYELHWDYYAKDDPLDENIENNWLREAPMVLIGYAGLQIAKDLRDNEAVELFNGIFTEASRALFGEMVVQEDASQPLVMGADL